MAIRNPTKTNLFVCIAVLYAAAFIFPSCHRKTSPGVLPEQPGDKPSTSIQWLFISIGSTMDTVKKQASFRILQKQVADGKTSKKENEAEAVPGNWKIALTDDKSNVLDWVIIPNPHFRDMEYQHENGQLAKKTIFTSYIEVPLRFTYTSAAKKIEIAEIESTKKQKKLFSEALVF